MASTQTPPRGYRLACHALGAWLGLLLATIGVAAVAFPTMRDLDPTLPAYGEYDGPHWSLAAGVVAERVFEMSAWARATCLMLAAVGIACAGRRSLPHVLTLGISGLLLAASSVWLNPTMGARADEYRAAAAAGDSAAAETAKADFDTLHPVASRLMGAESLAVVICGVGLVVAGGGRDKP